MWGRAQPDCLHACIGYIPCCVYLLPAFHWRARARLGILPTCIYSTSAFHWRACIGYKRALDQLPAGMHVKQGGSFIATEKERRMEPRPLHLPLIPFTRRRSLTSTVRRMQCFRGRDRGPNLSAAKIATPSREATWVVERINQHAYLRAGDMTA